MCDIQRRRIWNLTTGKLIDDCDVENTTDEVLHRALPQRENIRVELILKNALKLFERMGRTWRRSTLNRGSAKRSTAERLGVTPSDRAGAWI